jgi:anthranilate synthase/aminodeoxychorismate synthase-like glutamine amidotransferase
VILIIDNYDSFVYNIARYFEELGEAVVVKRNDDVDVETLQAKAIVVSPGPCTPHEAGASLAIIEKYSGQLPILGICLGHQCIGEVFGGQVVRAQRPMHGEASEIIHGGEGIFKDIPNRFNAGRYHSLIVESDGMNAALAITARSENGEIMGLQHRRHPTFGVQFHPESILTEHGYTMLRNFLEVVN